MTGGINGNNMAGQAWWKEALSAADNISTTRICFLAANAFVFIMVIALAISGKFTLDWGWFLLGIYTTAWGGKDVAKYMEVKRELNKMGDIGGRGAGSYSRYNMAKGGDKRP